MLRAKTSKAERRGRRQAPRGMAIAAREPEGGFVLLSPKPCRSCARAVGRMCRRSCARANSRVPRWGAERRASAWRSRAPGEVECRAKSSAGRGRMPVESRRATQRTAKPEVRADQRAIPGALSCERSWEPYLASDPGQRQAPRIVERREHSREPRAKRREHIPGTADEVERRGRGAARRVLLSAAGRRLLSARSAPRSRRLRAMPIRQRRPRAGCTPRAARKCGRTADRELRAQPERFAHQLERTARELKRGANADRGPVSSEVSTAIKYRGRVPRSSATGYSSAVVACRDRRHGQVSRLSASRKLAT